MTAEKQSVQMMTDLVREAGFDSDNFDICAMLRALLKPVVDEGTHIDSGGGRDSADLWPKIGGVEYFITVRKSNNQLAKELQGAQ